MTELTTLVKAAQQGDKTAFGQIVIRFQDMAYASAYALVGDPGSAQDVAQEAFLDAYLNLAKLREPAAFPVGFDALSPVIAIVIYAPIRLHYCRSTIRVHSIKRWLRLTIHSTNF